MIDFHKGFKEFESLGEKKPRKKEKENKVYLSKKTKESFTLDVPKNLSQAQALYSEARSFIKTQFDVVMNKDEKNLDFKGIVKLAENICDVFERSIPPGGAIRLFFEHDECEGNYIYSHSVNVCFMCLSIAMELTFPRKKMIETAICSLFHDVGMMKIPLHIWNNEGALKESEYRLVQEHPLLGEGIFTNVNGISEVVPLVIGQHQEKIDGSGYPGRLKIDNIHYLARLISLVDCYETQTHSRKWKAKVLPDKTIQDILDNHTGQFDPHFMKALLRVVSIYPEGSFVRISSGEICKVVGINKEKPMRPIVTMIYDSSNNIIGSERTLDLSKQMLVHIDKCVEPSQI